MRENTWVDRGVTLFTMVGQAMPSFWLALILMIVLGLQLGILPISGTGTWQHFVMPGIVLAFSAIPALTRLTRSGMIEAMASDYIRTARAKGLSRASHHASSTRCATPPFPVVSIAAVQLGFMLGGSIVIETVFALHGVGYLGWESIAKNDFPVVQAVVLVLAVIYIGLTLLADILNAVLDPRLRDRMSAADCHSVPAARRVARRHAPASRSASLIVGARRCWPRSSAMRWCRTIRSPRISASACMPPFWMEGTQAGHLLGTDQLGRDYLARLVYGARISLLIGIMTVITSGLIGITLGVLGGFFGGRVDDVVLFAITTRLSIPVVLVALAVVGLMGSRASGSSSLTLGLLLWDRFAVVARATTMQVRNLDYVSAAWCAGASTPHILIKEILPNIASHLAVVATLEMALAILLEAALSFLGLGVPPPLPSWGLMIAEGKDYMFFSPWVIMIPGVALFVLVLGINLVGDGLRDLLGAERLR